MNNFIECIVKRKKTVADYGIWLLTCLVAFLCCFIVLSLQAISTYIVILFWLVVGIAYLAYRVIVSRNIEYEYAFFNGDLSIDKITNRKRRKRIISVEVKNFETFEQANDGFINRVKNITPIKIIHAEGDINSTETYGAIFNNRGIKTCLYIQPNDKILDAINRRRR
ncbi:MAG: DUF6106 family protein [Eubacteriales bacterium]|nr:DUF6106 family protein [Eubacteriales bacterium]